MLRRAHTSTPPKPASDILANATNNSTSPGGTGADEVGSSGAGSGAGGESEGMAET
jgi:hypothetical protein